MPADTLSLEGKVAVVTGSGRENGIGAGIAIALARNGAHVALNYVSDSTSSRAEALAQSIRKDYGVKSTAIKASVSTKDGAQFLVDETLKAFSTDHIDILVNNAGIAYGGGVLDTKPDEIDRMFDTNTKGTIYTVQAAVPHMPHGGRIINVSSSSARRGQVTVPVYGSTKAAIDAITWSLAKELGRSRGITVNSIAPGPVITDIVPEGMEDFFMGSERAETRAADRYGTIEDMGDAVLLLVSEKARWITGQYIGVNGGLTGAF